MPIAPRPVGSDQLFRLARAHAITLEQIELAKDLVTVHFGGSEKVQNELAVHLVQILATNYLADATMANKPK